MTAWILLGAVALAASTLSGMVGLGGGSLLLAVMAWSLAPELVVPLHGLVQMASNGLRGALLFRHVAWRQVAYYVPGQILGVLVARELYRDFPTDWLRPVIGLFLLWCVLSRHLVPARLRLPLWVLIPGGFGGGLLSIFVGVTGPYIAVFFLRDDLEKEEIVATKALLQWVGHAAKIPVFMSLQFDYFSHLQLVLPLMGIAVVGTILGTRLLQRLSNENFRRIFDAVLLILALRLAADPWWR